MGRHAAVARLATAQHGVVTRGQLLALEVPQGAIEHRLAAVGCTGSHRGVYAAGHVPAHAAGPRLRRAAGLR